MDRHFRDYVIFVRLNFIPTMMRMTYPFTRRQKHRSETNLLRVVLSCSFCGTCSFRKILLAQTTECNALLPHPCFMPWPSENKTLLLPTMDQLTSLPPLVLALVVPGAIVVGALTLKVRKIRRQRGSRNTLQQELANVYIISHF